MYLEIPVAGYGNDMYSSRPRPVGSGVSPRVAWDNPDTSPPLPFVRSSSSLSRTSLESSKNQWNNLKRGQQRGPKGGRPSVARRPSSRVSASSNGTPGPWLQPPGSLTLDGTETPRKEGSRRTSIQLKAAKPQSAWQMFEEHIKEIDDSTPYFARNQRKFRSSDAFRQVLNDIDFSQPSTTDAKERHDSDDLDTVINAHADGLGSESPTGGTEFGDGGNTDRGSPNTSVLEDPWAEDPLSRSVGFRTPVPPSILEDTVGEAEEEKKPEDQYIAVKDMTSDPDQTRNALYHRYLARPDTWANGLKKYLTKTTTRERVSSSSASPHMSTVGFRPRSTSQTFKNPAEMSQYSYATRGRAASAYRDAAVGLNTAGHKKRRAKSAGVQLSKQY